MRQEWFNLNNSIDIRVAGDQANINGNKKKAGFKRSQHEKRRDQVRFQRPEHALVSYCRSGLAAIRSRCGSAPIEPHSARDRSTNGTRKAFKG
ncbi:MAG TPA: hypothetical protein VLA17_17165 [Candidatus Limnocylindria bacterium]|nr:hypothetical protein [Candidatus Limnocylindria bacterium]